MQRRRVASSGAMPLWGLFANAHPRWAAGALAACSVACAAQPAPPKKDTARSAAAPVTPSTASAAAEAARARLEADARAFVAALAEARWADARGMLDETMLRAIPEDGLSTMWTGLQDKFGPFQSVSKTTRSDERGFDIVVVSCRFERSSVNLLLVFDVRGKIAAMRRADDA